MIIYYIVMNKNAVHDNLTEEFAEISGVLHKATKEPGQAIILARLIEGVSKTGVEKACKNSGLDNWQIYNKEDIENSGLYNSADTVLSKSQLMELLKQELLRITRNGGCLSLVSAQVTPIPQEENSDKAQLQKLLGSAIRDHLDSCDSVGLLTKGQYICCLPGIGQLAARNFAETTQKDFNSKISQASEHGKSFANVACAIGIVNLIQGDSSNVMELLKRSRMALEIAINKSGSYIHQETSGTPLENTTLVHSSEKRFLFFGGDAT